MRHDKKKVIIIDDSALMRRMICDIIETDSSFEVADMAADGEEGLKFLMQNSYDVMVLDVVMPRLDGIGLLKKIQDMPSMPNVIVFSREVGDGTAATIQALELGAFDFIKKPGSILEARGQKFISRFLSIMHLAAQAGRRKGGPQREKKAGRTGSRTGAEVSFRPHGGGNKIVAIASSTGGPRALQSVIPYLPEKLDAPVLVVQHMPAGFTASLAQRLDDISPLHVQEVYDGMEIRKGNVYIARGGYHMEAVLSGGRHYITLNENPVREGVRPCANYMYESLAATDYDFAVCVVLTGMGSDGTEGIKHLRQKKKIYTITQNEESCVVYGMPRAAYAAGIADQVEPIDKVAAAIIKNVGVR